MFAACVRHDTNCKCVRVGQAWTPAQHMHAEYHTLDTSTPASVAHYFPAHLHIDIVEKAQVPC